MGALAGVSDTALRDSGPGARTATCSASPSGSRCTHCAHIYIIIWLFAPSTTAPCLLVGLLCSFSHTHHAHVRPRTIADIMAL